MAMRDLFGIGGSGPRLDRRRFLMAGGAAAALAAAGLRPSIAGADGLRGDREVLTSSHWGAFRARVVDGRLVGVAPFERDPFPSAMIQNFPAILYDKSRIAAPMVRKSWLEKREKADGALRGREPFVEVDWDTALDLVAEEMRRVKAAYGNEAFYAASYGWASGGRFHACDEMTNRLYALHGGYVDDLTNYSFGAGMVLLPHVLGGNEIIGGPFTTWSSIVRHTQLIVMFGGAAFKNAQITWGGSGEHTTEKWLRQCHASGIEMVSINPVREDEVAVLGLEWRPIRPNTDIALMLALSHTLLTEGLADLSFAERYTVGLEKVQPYVLGETDGQPKDADWAAAICDVPADWIRALARKMAAKRTMIMTAWSLQRARFGEQPWWGTVLLAALLGQIGLPGGGFGFSYTSINGYAFPPNSVSVGGFPRGRNPVKTRIPVSHIAEMLLKPGEAYQFNGREFVYPDIKMIHWAGGNPFHHHQDLNRLSQAWARPETIVVHEPWWTPTARRADIVLPATTTLERNDIGASPRDRYIFAMPQLVEPVGGARNDYDIFSDLAERLGVRAEYTEGRDEMAWLRHLYAGAQERAVAAGIVLPDFDTFWDEGVVVMPRPEQDYVYMADFRADPEANALYTDSGKIELFSERIAAMGYDDCPGHPTWMEPEEWLGRATSEAPLHLISSHPQHRLHSQMDNGPLARASKIQGREPLWLNPADAERRGLATGDVARLFNARGEAQVGILVSDRVMPGVAMIHEGAWIDPLEPGLPGTADKHGNPNMVTWDVGTSKLGQGCSAQTAMVQVEKLDGPLPEITAFDPPEVA
jgi:biotin/methionine sulfoxide reductase